MKPPFVTIYTITYNQANLIIGTLESLLLQDYDLEQYEIIVLDDGSSDNTLVEVHHIANQSPVDLQLISVSHEADYLSAKRWNQCISRANPQTEVFIQLDDVIARPSLISQHVKWHQADWNYLVTGAKFEGKTETWDVSSCRRSHLSEDGRPVETEYFTAVWGASLSYTRQLMNKVFRPPYDVPYDMRMSGWGYHEVELAFRMKQAGCHIIYDPSAGVFHKDHEPENEVQRHLNRELIVTKGSEKNLCYILEKHHMNQLPRW